MEYLLKKIRSSIYCIKEIKPFLDRKTLLLLYYTLVKSHILYCITLWCFGNETIINKLQCAVKKLMRSIFNVGKRQMVSYVMKDDKLLTIRHPSFCRVHITKQAMRYKGPLIWMLFHVIFDKIFG